MSDQPTIKNGEPPDQAAPEDPTWKAVKTGAKWGMVVGFVIAQTAIWSRSIDTPFGSVYPGNDMWLVYLVCIGLGIAIGAGIAWLNMQRIGEDDDVPPRSFPREPIE